MDYREFVSVKDGCKYSSIILLTVYENTAIIHYWIRNCCVLNRVVQDLLPNRGIQPDLQRGNGF